MHRGASWGPGGQGAGGACTLCGGAAPCPCLPPAPALHQGVSRTAKVSCTTTCHLPPATLPKARGFWLPFKRLGLVPGSCDGPLFDSILFLEH